MEKRLIVVLLSAFLLMSCNRMMTSDLSPSSIEEVQVLKPATSIDLISKGEGNKTVYNDSLTEIAESLVYSAITSRLSNHFQISDISLDSATQSVVEEEIRNLNATIRENNGISDIPIPSTMDSIMEKTDSNYLVCTMYIGFSRAKGNYGAQLTKGFLTGIATLGMFYTVPLKAESELSVVILDKRNGNIAFYNRHHDQADPVKKSTTQKQMDKIFKEYLN